jgi:hypothetical protein
MDLLMRIIPYAIIIIAIKNITNSVLFFLYK